LGDASAASSASAAAASATSAGTSATNAATSATSAATSATAAATSATNAATSATAAAASATSATGYALSLSAVITADPAPAVIGTEYPCDSHAGAFSVTLPAIGAGNHGKRIGFTVTTTSANAVTPVPAGSDTLGGGVTTVSGAYGRLILMADNSVSPKVWRPV